MNQGLLIKGTRKKLHFTPKGLAHTASLAADMAKLQTLYTCDFGLSELDAQNCALAMVATLPEDSRKQLVDAVGGRMGHAAIAHETPGQPKQ